MKLLLISRLALNKRTILATREAVARLCGAQLLVRHLSRARRDWSRVLQIKLPGPTLVWRRAAQHDLHT